MASIRKRRFGPDKDREAWVVDYVDQHFKRHIKTFKLKKEADNYLTTVRQEVREGLHTPASKSITVAKPPRIGLTSSAARGVSGRPSTNIVSTSGTISFHALAPRDLQD
jgi:hypothetical protein